jgi:hypothetical protein
MKNDAKVTPKINKPKPTKLKNLTRNEHLCRIKSHPGNSCAVLSSLSISDGERSMEKESCTAHRTTRTLTAPITIMNIDTRQSVL